MNDEPKVRTVSDLETLEWWCHGWGECFACGNKWVAVWPLGAWALECLQCLGTDTDRDQGGDDD